MSYFSVNKELIVDHWPLGIGRLPHETRTFDTMDDVDVIPEAAEDLFEFLQVVARDSSNRRLIDFDLVYAPSEDERTASKFTRFSVHLQGIVKALNLSPYGNWRKHIGNAPQAMQFLDLEDGGYAQPMHEQKEGLRRLTDYISTRLHRPVPDYLGEEKLRLTRPTFSEIPARQRGEYVSVTLPYDPRTQLAEKIARRYYVDHRIRARIRRADGFYIPIVPDAIRIGDFVDVAVTAVIRQTRGRQGLQVYWGVKEVTRLLTAAEMKPMLSDAPSEMTSSDAGITIVDYEEDE